MIADRGSAFVRASNCLRLAAAPTFAIVALLTSIGGGPKDLLCSAAHGASPMSGMVAMYLLMTIFHAPPWLKLISSRREEIMPSKTFVREQGARHSSQGETSLSR